MNVVKYGALALLVIVAGFAGVVAMQPSTSHIERSQVVAASVADIQPLVTDMNAWLKWNPWSAMEPDQKVTLSDPAVGKGAWYTWEGAKTGTGKLAIVDVVDGQKVVESLEFTAPMQSTATVTFSFVPEGEGTKVVWTYDEANIAFMGKAAGLVMDMDGMLGGDFEKGLTALAGLAEQAKAERIAAEQAAAAAAAAAVAPAEAPPAP